MHDSEQAHPRLLVGTLILEPEVAELIAQGRLDIAPSLRRHLANDWGEASDGDRRANAYASLHGGEYFSSYEVGAARPLWIVSEWDRRTTTLLLAPAPDNGKAQPIDHETVSDEIAF
jgi:hypothetical protein